MVVDSDDWLTYSALNKTFELINRLCHEHAIGTIATPIFFPAKKTQNQFSTNKNPCTIGDWYISGSKFDTSMIRRVQAFRSAPFPEVEGEFYMAESWQHYRISSHYLYYLDNTHLVSAEYQSDGLSAQSRRRRQEAPLSAMLVYFELLQHSDSLLLSIKHQVNIGRYWWHAKIARKLAGNYFTQKVGMLSIAAGFFLYAGDTIITSNLYWRRAKFT